MTGKIAPHGAVGQIIMPVRTLRGQGAFASFRGKTGERLWMRFPRCGDWLIWTRSVS